MNRLNRNLAGLLAFLIFFSYEAGHSQTLPDKEVMKCASESNPVNRLACFDTLFTRFKLSTATSTSVTSISKWRVRNETSKIDDNVNVFLSLRAESDIAGWPSKRTTPSLIIRCKENVTSAYLVTGMAPAVEYGASGSATVTLRFDKEPAVKIRTSKSTDGEALFFTESIDYIKKMMNHSSLLFLIRNLSQHAHP